MSLQALTYLVVGASFALYIGIAIWSRAHNTGDFYIAGKGVSPIANGMATAADWMSAASFLSMAGLIAFLGYDGSVYLMGWTGGYVLLALLLAPYLRKFGKFTVPEFIGERYYSQTARIVAEGYGIEDQEQAVDALGPGGGPDAVLQALDGCRGATGVVLVGHEPDRVEMKRTSDVDISKRFRPRRRRR